MLLLWAASWYYATVMGSTWLADVAGRTNAYLHAFLEEKRAEADATSPLAGALVAALADLTERGGKRLRPCAVHAGFRAVSGEGEDDTTVAAGASLELLQTYLLIQDDWMDGDLERRGGPSVHAKLAADHGDQHVGASLAMLAADFASGFAWELLARAPFPVGRLRQGMATYSRMHFEVICGQQLDLLEHPDVRLVHDLKSGSYTVRGPLLLGAQLGSASEEQLEVLSRFGEPIGVAFQLRDDLLGTFGDPARTGKPSGNDIRAGKFTSLIAEASKTLSEADFAPIKRALGSRDASDQEIDTARELLESCGARSTVEVRLASLIAAAEQALVGAPLRPEGVAMLEQLLGRLASRES